MTSKPRIIGLPMARGLPSFVQTPDEKFLCVQCTRVLTPPAHQTPCGHRYCLDCINKLFSDTETAMCPGDEENCVTFTRQELYVDNATKRGLMRLEDYCTYRENGCPMSSLVRASDFEQLRDSVQSERRTMTTQQRQFTSLEEGTSYARHTDTRHSIGEETGTRTRNHDVSVTHDGLQHEYTKEKNWRVCKICNVNKQNYTLKPCGHVLCFKCLSQLKTQRKPCPYCRQIIFGYVRFRLPNDDHQMEDVDFIVNPQVDVQDQGFTVNSVESLSNLLLD